jgi:hypothetical protein
MKTYVDRNGCKLEPGQLVRVQHCVGEYGQVAVVEGELKSIGSCNEVYLDCPGGGCLYPGFAPDWDREYGETADVLIGYTKFSDFEHGHEKFIEILR